jgi:hypothetical protein
VWKLTPPAIFNRWLLLHRVLLHLKLLPLRLLLRLLLPLHLKLLPPLLRLRLLKGGPPCWHLCPA